MTVTTKSRLALAATVLSTLFLSACTNSVPPGSEVAYDMIDTLDISDAKKACMHKAVANFTVPVAAGDQWKTIDDVAEAAAKEPADAESKQAKGIIDDFFKKAYDNCPDTAATSADSSASDSGATG